MSLYDIEKFDPQPDPDLICCICQCVLYKAVESPCRHVFCQACIERWLSKRHTCPTCRKRTRKVDLKPVLPLVQNMLNRLLMKCDFYNNGCIPKIMLEHYEVHVKDCGYEMKTCKFIKCGQKILKMNLEQHENELCEHRESICEGECGLMIALSDKQGHNCVSALKAHIEEKNRMIETLKAKLQELNNLSQTLNDQLEQLRQQLDENRPMSFSPFLSTSSDSVVSDMSDDLREVSMDIDSSVSSNMYANGNADYDEVSTVDQNFDREGRNEAIDVVQQVERTVVSSLIDLSSRLERVRNQMRSVLDRGVMDEDNNLSDDVHIPSDALNAIVNSSQTNPTESGTSQSDSTRSNMDRSNMDVNNSSISSNANIPDMANNVYEREISQNNRSSEPSVSEYSPASFYSNSDISEGEWVPNNTSTNQNESTVPANHRGTDQDTNQTDRVRSTQRWVQSVIQSPVHIIESQPPRSPSESDSSYSSIPSISSIHSICSGQYRDNDQSSNRERNDIDIGSPQSANSVETSADSITEDTSSRTLKHQDDEYSDTDETTPPSAIVSSSETGSHLGLLLDSSTDGQSDSKSVNTHSGASDDDNDLENESIHQNESELRHLSDNSDSDTALVNSKEHKSSALNYESDASDISSAASDKSNKHSIDTCGKNTGNSPKNLPSSAKLKTLKRSVRKNIEQGYCSEGENERFNTINNTDQTNEDSQIDRQNELKGNTSSGYKCDSSNTLSDSSEPSEQESRRTWKYETNNPSKRHTTITSYQSDNEKCLETFESGSPIQKNQHRSNERLDERKYPKEKGEFKVSTQASHSGMSLATQRTEITGNKHCNTSTAESTEDQRKITDSRKRRHNRLYDINEPVKRSCYGNAFCGSNSPGYSNQQFKQNSPRAESAQCIRKNRSPATIQSNIPTQDKNTQSLNVKIDLSLINYSGNILPQPVSQSAPTSTSTHLHSSDGIAPENYTVTGTLRQPSSSAMRSHDITQTGPKRQLNNYQIRTRETRSRNNIPRLETRQLNVTGHREFPNLWCDDSDSASDKTWEPEAGDPESDVTVSEEGEPESDTDYEVKVPKSTAELLEEYASDDTDESWTYGV